MANYKASVFLETDRPEGRILIGDPDRVIRVRSDLFDLEKTRGTTINPAKRPRDDEIKDFREQIERTGFRSFLTKRSKKDRLKSECKPKTKASQ